VAFSFTFKHVCVETGRVDSIVGRWSEKLINAMNIRDQGGHASLFKPNIASPTSTSSTRRKHWARNSEDTIELQGGDS
jgi:hypothetical protein